MIDSRFETLFEQATAMTPMLDGISPCAKFNALKMNEDASLWIQHLYRMIESHAPEAGRGYWLTYTWESICWQPIHLSLIGIYSIGGVPPIKSIAQYKQHHVVAGYCFEHGTWIDGLHADLIQYCAKQLLALFEHYRRAMEPWVRIRPGFSRRLIADELLSHLAKLRNQLPHFLDTDVISEATLWLQAFGFSEQLLDSYKWSDRRQGLRHVRSTCCQVYRCEGARLCCNCPRRTHNKLQPPYLRR